ncbi:sensor histidine kinase [Mycobacterium bohemicum DSM 44277]|uniref:Sensor histidine kinase MtrB n=1 Tax=Mycobacterium bohemicum DSM 44277 TaxID=1236609 RepID=A0A0U0WB69_MYCBE|nr:sensor histidine kinase [Mycobacterium bohemicum DSM 44277]
MLIVIEGVDGAGKRTLSGGLRKAFEAAGKSVAMLDFPRYGRSVTADLASEALHGQHGDLASSVYAMATLFALDRASATGEVEEMCRAHDVVILDRYVASNAAYSAARLREGAAASAAGPVDQVPNSLRGFIKAGQAAYQYATVHTDGFSGPALIIGTPASAQVANLELYLIFPLKNEQATITLVRGTMITGGVVLLVLLAGIALLVTRQVVVPVRSASRIAERFAEGHLSERMPVRGEDDMARLAVSFNDMAESLSRQITQLEEFGNLQRRFTSDVSHELRTPLTTVRMAADLIYDHSEDLDPTLRRSTELMVNELDRFETLLNDLLEISRHDAGVAELSVEALDLRATVRSALGNVGHLAEEAGIELQVDMPDTEVIAEVDARRVERILRNLIANAIDHAEHKPVQIRMGADEDTVAVTVRDFGVGLRPGEEKLVFSRFWRSDPSRVRRSGGTGLGLAISIEDARLHQGRLEAWGEPGQGACFRLTLPLVRGHKVTTSPLPLKPIPQPGVPGPPPGAATGLQPTQHTKESQRQREHAERSG